MSIVDSHFDFVTVKFHVQSYTITNSASFDQIVESILADDDRFTISVIDEDQDSATVFEGTLGGELQDMLINHPSEVNDTLNSILDEAITQAAEELNEGLNSEDAAINPSSLIRFVTLENPDGDVF